MINKQVNTSLRNTNINQVREQHRELMMSMERKYGQYCYMPLDVPIITESRLIDWFFDHCKKIVKLKPDVADTEYGYSLFNSVNVCLDNRYQVNNPVWSDNQYPNFQNEFPHFYQQMMDLLPLAQIPRFSFWNSTRPIAPHRDHTCMLDMPQSFRIMIYDENPVDTLYLWEDSDCGGGPKKYVQRLPHTNSYVWNNLRVEHGSDYQPGYRKILLLINNFIPKYQQYGDCIERSAATYSDALLHSTAQLHNFVDA